LSAGSDEALIGVLDLGEVFFKHLDERAVLAQAQRIVVMCAAVALALDGVDEFIAALEQFCELAAVLVLRREGFWLEISAKAAQEPGIDGIVLGEDAKCLGVTAHAKGLHEADGEAGLEGCADQGLFIAAAGFADQVHAGGIRMAGEGFQEPANCRWAIGQAVDDIEKIEDEFVLGDIDPDMDRAVLKVHNVSE